MNVTCIESNKLRKQQFDDNGNGLVPWREVNAFSISLSERSKGNTFSEINFVVKLEATVVTIDDLS